MRSIAQQKNRIYTKYYAEKKNQRRCLSEKVRYVVPAFLSNYS